MDKMAILAASTTEPSMPLRQRSDLVTWGPLAELAPHFHKTVSSASLFLFARTYFAVNAVVQAFMQYLLPTSQIIAVKTFLVSKFLAFQGAIFTYWLLHSAWNSPSARQFRKKLEFEFFVLVLGPSGNALVLLLFWPGWIILVPAMWAIRAIFNV